MKKLTIKIVGHVNSGKTTIAQLITKTLRDAGIETYVEENRGSALARVPASAQDDPLFASRLDALKGELVVDVETMQVQRDPRDKHLWCSSFQKDRVSGKYYCIECGAPEGNNADRDSG